MKEGGKSKTPPVCTRVPGSGHAFLHRIITGTVFGRYGYHPFYREETRAQRDDMDAQFHNWDSYQIFVTLKVTVSQKKDISGKTSEIGIRPVI